MYQIFITSEQSWRTVDVSKEYFRFQFYHCLLRNVSLILITVCYAMCRQKVPWNKNRALIRFKVYLFF